MQFGGQPTPWSEVEIEGLRLRSVSQILIQEIGAAGPENAEDSARRACGVIQRMADQIVSADARIAEMERDNERIDSQWRDELRIYRETENSRIAELEQAVTVRDTEIARLRDALDQSALEYADLAVSAKSLEEHLGALVEVSDDSTIARARAVMNGDDIGEDEDEARAGNGGGV